MIATGQRRASSCQFTPTSCASGQPVWQSRLREPAPCGRPRSAVDDVDDRPCRAASVRRSVPPPEREDVGCDRSLVDFAPRRVGIAMDRQLTGSIGSRSIPSPHHQRGQGLEVSVFQPGCPGSQPVRQNPVRPATGARPLVGRVRSETSAWSRRKSIDQPSDVAQQAVQIVYCLGVAVGALRAGQLSGRFVPGGAQQAGDLHQSVISGSANAGLPSAILVRVSSSNVAMAVRKSGSCRFARA